MRSNNIESVPESIHQKDLMIYTEDELVIRELMNYTTNHFIKTPKSARPDLPLKDEPHIADWKHYQLEVDTSTGIFEVLKKNLVPLNFPIQSGISNTDDYQQATLKGKDLSIIVTATGLPLKNRQGIKLIFVEGLVGKVPALIIETAEDFTLLTQALAHKNEPIFIPKTMGAILIKGVNNWGRLHKNIQQLKSTPYSTERQQEIKQLLENKALYQDRLMLISNKNYSNICPEGILESVWQEESVKIRLQHEYAHYFTKRYFGSMRNNIHDELIADYLGIHAVRPFFDAALFLQFMGLNNTSLQQDNGRLNNYLGSSSLSDAAVVILKKILVAAAHNVEHFDQSLGKIKNKFDLFSRLIVLTSFSLIELAASDGTTKLVERYTQEVLPT